MTINDGRVRLECAISVPMVLLIQGDGADEALQRRGLDGASVCGEVLLKHRQDQVRKASTLDPGTVSIGPCPPVSPLRRGGDKTQSCPGGGEGKLAVI